jgi:hypothetical protein
MCIDFVIGLPFTQAVRLKVPDPTIRRVHFPVLSSYTA